MIVVALAASWVSTHSKCLAVTKIQLSCLRAEKTPVTSWKSSASSVMCGCICACTATLSMCRLLNGGGHKGRNYIYVLLLVVAAPDFIKHTTDHTCVSDTMTAKSLSQAVARWVGGGGLERKNRGGQRKGREKPLASDKRNRSSSKERLKGTSRNMKGGRGREGGVSHAIYFIHTEKLRWVGRSKGVQRGEGKEMSMNSEKEKKQPRIHSPPLKGWSVILS